VPKVNASNEAVATLAHVGAIWMSTSAWRCYDLAEFHGFDFQVRTLRVTVVLLAFLSVEQIRAQTLAFALFERYLEPLRTQVGIPGLSAAIVQNGRVVWERGFGVADVERNVAVFADTPFPIGDLTEIFGSTLVMQRIERGDFQLQDRIDRWTALPESGATIQQVLTHTSTGSYSYAPARFAALTNVIDYYTQQPYRLVLARDVLKRLAMIDSVPGLDLQLPSPFMRELFEADDLDRFQRALQRIALPYRVDSRGRAVRSEFPPPGINAATGLVSTVRDLAKFDAALDDGALLGRDLLAFMRGGAMPGAPTGLGWFVQAHNGERLVWQFSSTPNAYSALMLKVPSRGLTLILLANSDGLSAPFALHNGDVTSSLFAKLFLRMFVS
jgi:CubicO group peptidase (beta-lactamase class C family)